VKRARLFVLVEGYLEGSLSPAERQELAAAVAADAQVATIFVEQVRLARRLRAALRPQGQADTWTKISALVTPQEPERRRKVADRVDVLIGEGQSAIARRAARRRWTAAGVMAGAAVAVMAVMLMVGGDSDRPPAPASPLSDRTAPQAPPRWADESPRLPLRTGPLSPIPATPGAEPPPTSAPLAGAVPIASPPAPGARAAMVAEMEQAEGADLAQRADVLAYLGFDRAAGRLPGMRGRLRPRFNQLAPGLSGRGLRVSYGNGQSGGLKAGGARFFLATAAQTSTPAPTPTATQRAAPAAAPDELYLRYYVRLSDDFDFGGGGILPGLCLGACRPAWRASGAEGRTIRLHWTRFGELAFEPLPGSAPGKRRWDRFLERGTWHALEMRVRLNTPGVADGVIEGWFDGDKVASLDGLRLREASSTHVEGVLFESFRRVKGTAAATGPGATTFDNVVVATAYIGPRGFEAK
jgi:hypothetical protein